MFLKADVKLKHIYSSDDHKAAYSLVMEYHNMTSQSGWLAWENPRIQWAYASGGFSLIYLLLKSLWLSAEGRR